MVCTIKAAFEDLKSRESSVYRIILSCSLSFAVDRIGWKQEKVNELLLPVLKKINAKPSGQAKLTQFFPTGPAAHVSGTLVTGELGGGQGRAIRSKRLRCAITRIKGVLHSYMYSAISHLVCIQYSHYTY